MSSHFPHLPLICISPHLPLIAAHISAAIKINETYFRYFLGRGFAHQALGQSDAARQDFEASQRLFQTEAANRALNEL